MNSDKCNGMIVVGVDGSVGSHGALGWAFCEAVARGVDIEAVFALPTPGLAYEAPGYLPPSSDEMTVMGQKALDTALDGWSIPSNVKVRLSVKNGRPVEVLRQAAAEPDVGLVVVGSRGHGLLAELVLGSVSHGLTHVCPKPVVIVPKDALASGDRHAIVVGVDGSPEADSALRWAAQEAIARDADLQVTMVTSPPRYPSRPAQSPSSGFDDEARRELTAAIDRLGPTEARIRERVLVGDPAHVLVGQAAKGELLVVGSHGRGRAKEALLGSVSHGCAHQTKVPVAIVPSQA